VQFTAAREQQDAVIETREQPILPMSKQEMELARDELYDMYNEDGSQEFPSAGPQIMTMVTSASAYHRGSVQSSMASDGDSLDAMFDDALDVAANINTREGDHMFKRMSMAAKGRMQMRPALAPEQAHALELAPSTPERPVVRGSAEFFQMTATKESSPEDAHPPPARTDPEDFHPEEEKPPVRGLLLPYDNTPPEFVQQRAGANGGLFTCCEGRSKPPNSQEPDDACVIL